MAAKCRRVTLHAVHVPQHESEQSARHSIDRPGSTTTRRSPPIARVDGVFLRGDVVDCPTNLQHPSEPSLAWLSFPGVVCFVRDIGQGWRGPRPLGKFPLPPHLVTALSEWIRRSQTQRLPHSEYSRCNSFCASQRCTNYTKALLLRTSSPPLSSWPRVFAAVCDIS